MKIRNMKQVTERVKGLKGKKLFRRNQIIITTLAVMIAAAGYLNYAGKRDLEAGSRLSQAGSLELSEEDLMAENLAAQSETVSDILSLDNDPADGEWQRPVQRIPVLHWGIMELTGMHWKTAQTQKIPVKMMPLQAMKTRAKLFLPAA